MLICEIFKSIQGEGIYTGFPCTFLRFSGCNLNCTYCDTEYAKKEFISLEIEEIIERINKKKTKLIMITGGEPLLQEDLNKLIQKLHLKKYLILLETNGSLSIKTIPKYVHISMDIKTPGSGMSKFNLDSNIELIKKTDEIKFVITQEKDFKWMSKQYSRLNLKRFPNVSVSPVWNKVKPDELAEWILDSGLPLRLNLQIHKILWEDEREK